MAPLSLRLSLVQAHASQLRVGKNGPRSSLQTETMG